MQLKDIVINDEDGFQFFEKLYLSDPTNNHTPAH